jgi:hypothetical protein
MAAKQMILFRFLKLFGIDVPGHIAQLQARFEQRVEVVKDEVRQTAQKTAIVAALGAVGGLAVLSAAGVGRVCGGRRRGFREAGPASDRHAALRR